MATSPLSEVNQASNQKTKNKNVARLDNGITKSADEVHTKGDLHLFWILPILVSVVPPISLSILATILAILETDNCQSKPILDGARSFAARGNANNNKQQHPR
jgi:hypothetical protein